MSDAIERPKSYEEGLRDGFIKGQEEANKVMEQMLHATCNPVVYAMPETEAVKILQEQIQKMKCCENCKHYKPAVTVNETIGNMCEDFENGCNNSEISPYNKWELSDKSNDSKEKEQ